MRASPCTHTHGDPHGDLPKGIPNPPNPLLNLAWGIFLTFLTVLVLASH